MRISITLAYSCRFNVSFGDFVSCVKHVEYLFEIMSPYCIEVTKDIKIERSNFLVNVFTPFAVRSCKILYLLLKLPICF